MGLVCKGALPRRVVERRPDNGGFSLQQRPSVDKLATPLGIDESLAFRAFDKTIIFGHWLSKNMGIGISLWGFPFEKGFYYILADYFQKSKNAFQKGACGIFMGLYNFPHMLYNFPSHANIGQQSLIYATPLPLSYIYIYIYIYCSLKKSFPFIKDCMTYTPF